MNIGSDHFLDSATKAVLSGGAPLNPCLLVIHFTSGMSAQSSIDWWKNPGAKGASAHVIIDRDGTIYQCRAFNRTAGHAGVSKWKNPKTGQTRAGCNAFSIGIEMANAGDCVDHGKAFGKYPLPAGELEARHKNGGPMTEWEKYPQAQLDACYGVAKLLVDHYRLIDLVGHEDIAPKRKNDPGPAMPMEALRAYCGFSGLPFVNR